MYDIARDLTKKMMQNFILRSFTHGAPYLVPAKKQKKTMNRSARRRVEILRRADRFICINSHEIVGIPNRDLSMKQTFP